MLALALAVGPALAQEADDESALVEALVVNARTPGPAWWSVSKGEAKVWVLGTGVPLPAGASWDSAAFQRRIIATRRLIYPQASGSTHFSNAALAADRPWLDELSAEERRRLAEAAVRTGRTVEFYGKYRPAFAGLLIKSELAAKADPKPAPPLDLEARARAARARMIPVKGRMSQALKVGLAKGQADGLGCVRWALEPRDPIATKRARAEAWARGDVRALMAGPMTYDPCIQGMKAMQASYESHETALADAIAATLDKGDGAVALVALTPLLRQGGVLDALRQRGYVVRTPAQLEPD